jgi:hypothetical protein
LQGATASEQTKTHADNATGLDALNSILQVRNFALRHGAG